MQPAPPETAGGRTVEREPAAADALTLVHDGSPPFDDGRGRSESPDVGERVVRVNERHPLSFEPGGTGRPRSKKNLSLYGV